MTRVSFQTSCCGGTRRQVTPTAPAELSAHSCTVCSTTPSSLLCWDGWVNTDENKMSNLFSEKFISVSTMLYRLLRSILSSDEPRSVQTCLKHCFSCWQSINHELGGSVWVVPLILLSSAGWEELNMKAPEVHRWKIPFSFGSLLVPALEVVSTVSIYGFELSCRRAQVDLTTDQILTVTLNVIF